MNNITFKHTNQILTYLNKASEFSKNVYTTNHFNVIKALLKHLNMKTMSCYPSNQTIANLAGVSLATAERVIQKLKTIGLIRYSQARYNKSSIRYINLLKLRVTVEGLTRSLKRSKYKNIVTIHDICTKALNDITKDAYKMAKNHLLKIFNSKTTKNNQQKEKLILDKINKTRNIEIMNTKTYINEIKNDQKRYTTKNKKTHNLKKLLEIKNKLSSN